MVDFRTRQLQLLDIESVFSTKYEGEADSKYTKDEGIDEFW